MKHNVYKLEQKKADAKNKGGAAKKLIGPDLPFDYDEMASITAPEYVRGLQRDGIAVLPNEELKKNIAGILLKAVEEPKCTRVSGFQVADDYYHHIGHFWVHQMHHGWVRIGIDDFSAKVFGPVDTIDLPPVGDFLMQGETGCVLTRNDRKAPMQSPATGIVFAVNDRIRAQPEITHKDPYGEGWLFILNPVSLEINLKELYFGKECFQWIERENRKLLELLGPRYERLAATGGTLVDDIFGHFPDISWDRLVRTFLGTTEKS